MTKFVISAVLDENKNLTIQTLPEQNQGENNCTAIQLFVPTAMSENTDFYLEFLCPKRKRYISPRLAAIDLTDDAVLFECNIPSCVLQEEGLVQFQLLARNSTDNTIVYKSNYSNKTAFYVHPSINACETYSVKDFLSEAQRVVDETSALKSNVETTAQRMDHFLQDVDLAIDEIVDQSIADAQKATTDALTKETSERKTADEQLDAKLQQAISDEAAARTEAISAETAARTQAISAETAARTQAISAETAARTQAISAETAAREAAIASEAEAREQSITREFNKVANKVTAEIGARVDAVDHEANVRLEKDTALEGSINTHVADKNNPHTVTKAQLGLGNVDNVRQYSATNPNFSTTLPKADGTASIGVASTYSRSDHVHPADANVVKTSVQNFSDAQKAQARANIGAGTSNFSGSWVDLADKPNGAALDGVVKYVAQPLTEEEKTQARENIGAAPLAGIVLCNAVQNLTEMEKGRARSNIDASNFTGDYNALTNKPKPFALASALKVEKKTRYLLNTQAGLTVATSRLSQYDPVECQFEVKSISDFIYNKVTLPATAARLIIIIYDFNGMTIVRCLGYTEAVELIVDEKFTYIRDQNQHGVYFSTLSDYSMGGYFRITEYPSLEDTARI